MNTFGVPGEPLARAGFTSATRGDRAVTRRTGLVIHAIAALGLILSLTVAATAVSIGIARAQCAAPANTAATH